MELRQMVLTISQLQSSGLPGAVIYDYFDKITFILTDKSPENGVFRMLARLEHFRLRRTKKLQYIKPMKFSSTKFGRCFLVFATT
ncbi:MAG: hypothetical protein QF588_06360, partial [Candidatus Poseidoniaceae archaeon]|nr:hypothetical protein [Candidatus Poseidoniaceae archaeon]